LELPFNHVFFTGSPRVGKIIMATAAKHLASVTLELGGKSPTIISDSVNIKDAAAKVAWGKWQNAGQICVAPDYLFVHESIKKRFIDELSIQSEKIYGSSKNYGGIINRLHHNRINDLMADAIEKGADIEFGGKSDRKNLRFSPTLLSKVSPSSRVMQEEIFGPILPLITYSNFEEVIKYINSRDKPLALYLFTRRKKEMQRIEKETSSGSLVINDTVIQFAHPHLAFGGVNTSGIGKSHGYAGFIAFSNEKAVIRQRIGLTMTKLVYPPYTNFKRFLINFLIKYSK
jgi:aldehyde dehydrogenase (NAD+)